jgi:hypothetical protein
VSIYDCIECGRHLGHDFKPESEAIHPGMIGINPPDGDLVDFEDLLKKSMSNLISKFRDPKFCNHCQEYRFSAFENQLFIQDRDKIPQVMIVNVETRVDKDGQWTNPFNVQTEIDMTDFIRQNKIESEEGGNLPVVATLTGYIQRVTGLSTVDKDTKRVIEGGHYVSTTKSLLSNDYFYLDDLIPNEARNVGEGASCDNRHPIVWMFYTVSGADEGPDAIIVEEWIAKYKNFIITDESGTNKQNKSEKGT